MKRTCVTKKKASCKRGLLNSYAGSAYQFSILNFQLSILILLLQSIERAAIKAVGADTLLRQADGINQCLD